VILDSSLNITHETHTTVSILNPYVPGFLSFREAPPLLPSITSAPPPLPDYLLADGNGILHPRGLGFASHLGILLSTSTHPIPTIGVGKNIHAFKDLRTSLFPNVDVTAKMIKSIFKAYAISSPPDIDPASIVNLRMLPQPSLVPPPSTPPPSTPPPTPPSSAVLYLYSNNQFETPCGAAYLNAQTANVNPVFVSSGHAVSLREAIWIVHKMSEYRIPEPIRRADLGGREKVRSGGRLKTKAGMRAGAK